VALTGWRHVLGWIPLHAQRVRGPMADRDMGGSRLRAADDLLRGGSLRRVVRVERVLLESSDTVAAAARHRSTDERGQRSIGTTIPCGSTRL